MAEITKSILKNIYKKRSEPSKKYDYGLLIVIGGSEFYSGSPALTSLAAFKAGADMVRIIAPERAANIAASFTPDLAAFPLKGEHLAKEHLPILLQMAESAKEASHGKTAVVIGNGLGRSKETQETVLDFLAEISASIPIIIDADAIHAVSQKKEVLQGKNVLMTPHLFEFFVLSGKEILNSSEEDKIRLVKEEAAKIGCSILLKGATDIISDGKTFSLNKTGSPYMTKGGMGDTLAGIAGALMARGINSFEAGAAAAYINGLAGELAIKKMGESVLATDLINEIPSVIKF